MLIAITSVGVAKQTAWDALINKCKSLIQTFNLKGAKIMPLCISYKNITFFLPSQTVFSFRVFVFFFHYFMDPALSKMLSII